MTAAMNRRQLLAASALIASAGSLRTLADAPTAAPGKAPDRIALWADGLPEPLPPAMQGVAQAVEFVQRSKDPLVSDRIAQRVVAPFIEVHRATGRAEGAAIVLMPGGGYRYMAWDKEGDDLARWFSARGVTAFVLCYRLPTEGWSTGIEAPLADAQRAIRLIRHRATELMLDPQRLAVMGFSAGGHLCANVATSYHRSVYAPRDAADRLDCRPNLAAPIYPAIKLDALPAGAFGPQTTPELIERNSPHRHMPEDAPPHFLLHAEDDPLVATDHVLALRAALLARKVSVETHLFARGGHGFGIRLTRGLPVDGWLERFMAYGRSTGWLAS